MPLIFDQLKMTLIFQIFIFLLIFVNMDPKMTLILTELKWTFDWLVYIILKAHENVIF